MKLNEYGDKCFAVGEVVKVNGKKYRFKKIVPNASNPCALYAEGQARVTGFCGECGGCGGSFSSSCGGSLPGGCGGRLPGSRCLLAHPSPPSASASKPSLRTCIFTTSKPQSNE